MQVRNSFHFIRLILGSEKYVQMLMGIGENINVVENENNSSLLILAANRGNIN